LKYDYFTDEEYEAAFDCFGGIRSEIAMFVSRIHMGQVSTILDIPAGHGYHIAEFSKIYPMSRQIGIGLPSDVSSYIELRSSNESYQHLFRNLEYLVCDATEIPLENVSCDLVVNFLGLEDIRMTLGEKGVRTTLSEMCRVLRDEGTLQISLAEYGDLEEERIAEEVWKTIGLDAVFFPREWYVDELQKLGMKPESESVFMYPKKMTAFQAAEELRFACDNAPKTFFNFGVTAINFEELWDRFGNRIENYGMAYWSRIRILLFTHEHI
jgi:ubiquinone/menaquinone biosynthesis C-methylase UbiE